MRKRKGFNPEHLNTFAKALTKINVPEDYLRNPYRIDSIRWYRRLQDSQAPGPSFVLESTTEVPRKTPKSPTTSALVYRKWLKGTSLIELLGTPCVYFSNPSNIKYNLGALAKFMYNVSVNSNWVHPPPGNPRGLAQKHCPGGSGFDF